MSLNVTEEELKTYLEEVITETLGISKRDKDRFLVALMERLHEEDPTWEGEDEYDPDDWPASEED
jgi:hypothetical protein